MRRSASGVGARSCYLRLQFEKNVSLNLMFHPADTHNVGFHNDMDGAICTSLHDGSHMIRVVDEDLPGFHLLLITFRISATGSLS